MNTVSNNWMKKLDTAYYGQFVAPELCSSIIDQFEPDEQPPALEAILSTLDYAILSLLMETLPEESVAQFLEEAEISYSDPQLLERLATLHDEIVPMIKQTVERQLLAMYSSLQS